MKIPEFETERLILRQVTLEDAPSYTEHFVDYEVIRHLGASVPWPYPEGGAAEYLKSAVIPRQGIDRWTWGLFLKENPGALIGVVDLWREGHPENRGFWLGRKFWGRGLMSEAVAPVMDYAFNDLGFERLIFSNAAGNARSARVKEKTGARFLRIEQAKFVDPAYTGHEIWELTREEWVRRRGG
jgi:ribosomal-protein-alanine N-acetyltransferase